MHGGLSFGLQATAINFQTFHSQDMVEEFMGKLTRHSEQSLQFLRFRLDFNEYYSTHASLPSTTQHKTHR